MIVKVNIIMPVLIFNTSKDNAVLRVKIGNVADTERIAKNERIIWNNTEWKVRSYGTIHDYTIKETSKK